MEQTHLEVLLEEIRSKFDLILEGHDALHARIDGYRCESSEKHDLTAFQLKVLNARIDALTAELAAHCADTEAHGRIWSGSRSCRPRRSSTVVQ